MCFQFSVQSCNTRGLARSDVRSGWAAGKPASELSHVGWKPMLEAVAPRLSLRASLGTRTFVLPASELMHAKPASELRLSLQGILGTFTLSFLGVGLTVCSGLIDIGLAAVDPE